ncbi:MAG: zinc ribbon domain-containing protein [Clostridia bacterium]|nr:zinc ribbon domain-containing protein [Clostridia bacterium]
MAIITCEKCGKKISDTTSKCIHCGAMLKKEQEAKVLSVKEEVKVPLDKTQYNTKFFSLDSAKQNKLEKEFLLQDKKAMKFKRRELEFKKFSSIGSFAVYISLLCILGVRLLLTKVLGVAEFYNEEYAVIGAVGIFVTLGIGILILIINFICKIIYNRSIKKYIYMKKFQRWLGSNKEIDFNPTFITNTEQALYNQIDLNTMDL